MKPITPISLNSRPVGCCPIPPSKAMRFGSRFDQRLFNSLNSGDPDYVGGYISQAYQMMDMNPSELYSLLTQFRNYWPRFSEKAKKTVEQQLARYTHKFLNSEPIE